MLHSYKQPLSQFSTQYVFIKRPYLASKKIVLHNHNPIQCLYSYKQPFSQFSAQCDYINFCYIEKDVISHNHMQYSFSHQISEPPNFQQNVVTSIFVAPKKMHNHIQNSSSHQISKEAIVPIFKRSVVRIHSNFLPSMICGLRNQNNHFIHNSIQYSHFHQKSSAAIVSLTVFFQVW